MAKEQSSAIENKTAEDALEQLESDPEQGLSNEEVERRRQEYGPNAIAEEKHHPVLDFISHFWGPIPWMIEIAAVLAGVAGRWEDFAVIGAMLVINGGVGFWHENKATSAIESLKKNMAPHATVIRNGSRSKVKASDLVPGDVIIMDIGDIVPADVKLVGDGELSIDESALTGESLPVDKGSGDMAYSSTVVKQGDTRALVTATGTHTRFAKTVELVESADQESHFQKAVMKIGYFLIAVVAVLVMVLVVVGILRNDQLVTVLLFGLGLILAGIPAALPAVLSVTMSIGAERLARKQAIVSRLAAMEEMAGLSVLCVDKTGTITKNQLALQDPVTIDTDDVDELVLTAALTCRKDSDDPIDSAILEGLDDRNKLDRYTVNDFRPFNPVRKRAEADVEHEGTNFTAAKGAVQMLLDLADANDEKRDRVNSVVDDLGSKGYRSLGVARRNDGDDWEFLGVLPMLDPPREDSAEVIASAQDHDIDIRMVTGDHRAISREIADKVGLGSDVVSAKEFFHEDEETGEVHRRQSEDNIMVPDVFAEVTPEHKFKIIKRIQARNRIVGMTGDGVNDAPALKQADVGIAVDGATDAARSASDLILTSKGLKVIVSAVDEARRIFERMTSYSTYRITETMRMILFITISVLVFQFYPVTPLMIVLLAILNDIPIMTIALDNVATAKGPVRWNMPRVLTIATLLSVTGVATSFGLFWYIREVAQLRSDTVQTIIFLKLLVAGHMTIYLSRNTGALWQKPYPSLVLFLALESTQVVGTLFAVYGILVTPIGWKWAGIVWAYALVSLLLLSGVKVATYAVLRKIGVVPEGV